MFDRDRWVGVEALLPLSLPSPEALVKEQSRLRVNELERGYLTYLDIVTTMSSSDWLMDQIRHFEFMVSLRAFMLEYQLVRKSDNAPVMIFSDRNIGTVMSILRRRGEHYYSFEGDSKYEDYAWEDVGAEFERLGFSFRPAPWNDWELDYT